MAETDTSNENMLEQILAQVKDLAVLPQVVFKIMESTANTDTSAIDLERNIQVDPGFSTKVLQMANSAYFALPRRITSIRDAVQFLGFKAVRQIAMSAGVFDLFVGKTDKESLRRRAWWRHSLDSANCAKWIAGHYHSLNAEEAYTAGLLHLIGKTIMDRFDSERYNVVLAGMEQGIPELFAESHFFGCNHSEVAYRICLQWGLPEELCEAVGYAEAPQNVDGATTKACVAVGHVIADLATHGRPEGTDLNSLFPVWATSSLGMTEHISDWVDTGIAAIAAANRAA